MKYRKKPVVIEARQVDASQLESLGSIMQWCGGRLVDGYKGHIFELDTLEGTMYADNGDWIICGVKGEFYPVKAEIFSLTYEPAEDHVPEVPEEEAS